MTAIDEAATRLRSALAAYGERASALRAMRCYSVTAGVDDLRAVLDALDAANDSARRSADAAVTCADELGRVAAGLMAERDAAAAECERLRALAQRAYDHAAISRGALELLCATHDEVESWLRLTAQHDEARGLAADALAVGLAAADALRAQHAALVGAVRAYVAAVDAWDEDDPDTSDATDSTRTDLDKAMKAVLG